METLIFKCPDCGANLEFDPHSNSMYCASCGQYYAADRFTNADTIANDDNKTETTDHKNVVRENVTYMQVRIFHCSSCGAELIGNDVEVTKTCAYCGQSTIIFDRVSNERQPEKILPFCVTKEQAVESAQSKFKKAKCLAVNLDEITLDSVSGIYMPYWVYSTEGNLDVEVTKKTSQNGYVTKTQNSKGTLDIPLDASRRLNDTVAENLYPFPLEKCVDFNPAYLSGFFGDISDVGEEERSKEATKYLYKYLIERALERMQDVPDSTNMQYYGEIYEKTGALSITTSNARCEVTKIQYMFLPIYFITFRIENKPVIILVNGATGKVVGSIPVDEEKLKKHQRKDILIHTLLYAVIFGVVFAFVPIIGGLVILVVVVGIGVIVGAKNKRRYDELLAKTNSRSMISISKNRE